MSETSPAPATTRRDFLQTSALAAGALALPLAANVHAAGNDTIKVGLIGCGSRGTGAAAQALHADKNVKLVAMGDAFADRIEGSLTELRKDGDLTAKLDVSPSAASSASTPTRPSSRLALTWCC